jgi:hypothetical protein
MKRIPYYGPGVDELLYRDMRNDLRLEALREAGCKCPEPLFGWRPQKGPRCRLCNTESSIYTNNGDK